MRMISPSFNIAMEMRWPLAKVPLRLPQSVRRYWPSVFSMMACSAGTVAMSIDYIVGGMAANGGRFARQHDGLPVRLCRLTRHVAPAQLQLACRRCYGLGGSCWTGL